MKSHTTLYTTGEFAKLCKVTKETLFYYDKIGLLKPESIAENNYRYYSFDQYFIMDMISVLKETGTSLKEIQSYMSKKSPEHYLHLMTQKRQALIEEQKKLERMQRSLESAINATQKGLSSHCQVPYLEEQAEEYFILTPATQPYTDTGYLKTITEHLSYCEQHAISIEFSVGSVLSYTQLQKGQFSSFAYISSKIPHYTPLDRIHVKPAGTYAVIEHKGFYDTLYESYQLLISFIQLHHLRITGNSYENDLLNYVTTDKESDYVIRVEIPVQE